MGKLVKVILLVSVIFTALFGGAIFYVTLKVKPEDIKKLVIDGAHKAMPGTQVTIKSIDYSIGTSLNLDLIEMDINLKDNKNFKFNKKHLFKVNNVKVKIPLWAIITQGGTINLNVITPQVAYQEFSADENSISLALESKNKKVDAQTDTKPQKTDKTQTDAKLELPAFISKSKINIKFTDVEVYYSLFESLSGTTKISRILLKDIGLDSASAFEIASDIKVDLDKKSSAATNLLVIGDVDLKSFFKSGNISSNIHLTLSNSTANFVPVAIPDIKASIKADIAKGGNLSTTVKLEIGTIVNSSIDAKMSDDLITVTNLDMKVNLNNAVALMPELGASLEKIKLNNTELFLSGNLKLTPSSSKLVNDFKFGLTKNIGLSIVDGLNAEQNFTGTFVNEKIQVITKTTMAGGEISSTIETKVSPLKQSFEMDKLNPIDIKVIGGNMKITKDFIQNFLYKSKSSNKEVVAIDPKTEKAVKVVATKVLLPTTKITMDLRQIYIDKAEVKLSGTINAKGNKVNSDDMKFSFDQGNGSASFTTTMADSLTLKNIFKFNLKGLDFSSFNAFLPQIEFLKGLEGNFRGDISGSLDLVKEKMFYNINADVAATKAKALGLAALKDKITPHLSKVKFIDENDFHIPDNFDAIKANVNATEKQITIKSAEFLGPTHTLDVVGINGNVAMTESPSRIDLKIKLKNPAKVEKWKKSFKTDAIDIRLIGKGFGLGLDTDAFIKTFTKMASNAVVNEAKTKATEKIKKDGKKMIEGLFKKKFKF